MPQNCLHFVPVPVLVDVFLGTRRTASNFKDSSQEMPIITLRSATTGQLPIKVKCPYASPVNLNEQYYWLIQHLKNLRFSTDIVRSPLAARMTTTKMDVWRTGINELDNVIVVFDLLQIACVDLRDVK